MPELSPGSSALPRADFSSRSTKGRANGGGKVGAGDDED